MLPDMIDRVSLGAPIIMSDTQHDDINFRNAQLYGGQTTLQPVAQMEAGSSLEAKKILEPAADPIRVGLQDWAVLSVIPDTDKRQMALKIRGCFDTAEAAQRHAVKLSDLDPYFDLYVVKMYNWLVLPIDDKMQQFIERKYKDPRLQQIMDSYREGLLGAERETAKQVATLRCASISGPSDESSASSPEGRDDANKDDGNDQQADDAGSSSGDGTQEPRTPPPSHETSP